jgi:hypothetical protein
MASSYANASCDRPTKDWRKSAVTLNPDYSWSMANDLQLATDFTHDLGADAESRRAVSADLLNRLRGFQVFERPQAAQLWPMRQEPKEKSVRNRFLKGSPPTSTYEHLFCARMRLESICRLAVTLSRRRRKRNALRNDRRKKFD